MTKTAVQEYTVCKSLWFCWGFKGLALVGGMCASFSGCGAWNRTRAMNPSVRGEVHTAMLFSILLFHKKIGQSVNHIGMCLNAAWYHESDCLGMLTKPKCWGHLCTPEALSLVNQMGTDWHDLAHLTRFEDLEHIVPQFFKIKFALKHKWFASGQISPASVTETSHSVAVKLSKCIPNHSSYWNFNSSPFYKKCSQYCSPFFYSAKFLAKVWIISVCASMQHDTMTRIVWAQNKSVGDIFALQKHCRLWIWWRQIAWLSPSHEIGKHGTCCTVPQFFKIKFADKLPFWGATSYASAMLGLRDPCKLTALQEHMIFKKFCSKTREVSFMLRERVNGLETQGEARTLPSTRRHAAIGRRRNASEWLKMTQLIPSADTTDFRRNTMHGMIHGWFKTKQMTIWYNEIYSQSRRHCSTSGLQAAKSRPHLSLNYSILSCSQVIEVHSEPFELLKFQ